VFAMDVLERRGWNPDDVRRWADLLRRSVAAEVRLIDDLLDATRISRNKMSIEPRPTDVHAEVAAALETVAPAVAEKRIRLEVDFALTQMADMAELVPGSVRTGGRTVEYVHQDYREVFRAWRALYNLAGVE